MKYTESHEWVSIDGDHAIVGISNYAQKELGEIVYIELPRIGHQIRANEEAVVIESSKAAADIYSPMSGEITEVNKLLAKSPEKVNQSAEKEGWLFKLKITHPPEYEKLMDEAAYLSFIGDVETT
ncbi:MAG: Glycine cleavage system H protein [Chlamydiae bacterium]|nr:Glycine cleavage system H protein [Chlamydiota bacterium]